VPQCFVTGTLVALADGTSKPIERIEIGDLVLGRGGRVNRVLGLERPTLGHRPLYALNGGRAFVTGGHPFWTAGGWKAVDAAAAAIEIPRLRVGQLAVGDRLTHLAAVRVPAFVGRGISVEPVEVRQGEIVLEAVTGGSADPATQLYNMRVDGDHTYFADDWLVHNKSS
jgi:hypothetical protein